MDAEEGSPEQWHVNNSPMIPTMRYGRFFLPVKIGKMTDGLTIIAMYPQPHYMGSSSGCAI